MAAVTVHALDAGHLTLPERFFISPADQLASHQVPSLSFLVQHYAAREDTPTRVVFDLGLRRNLGLYPEQLQAHLAERRPITTRPDVVESLHRGGLSPHDIDLVVFSHVHYDHVGYPTDFVDPKTKFIIGPGASNLLNGRVKMNGSHSIFEADLLDAARCIELPLLTSPDIDSHSEQIQAPTSGTDCRDLYRWKALPPFTHAIDIFGDSSVHILSAPGHLPGHLNLLVRTSHSPPRYVLLAGDACHDIRLFNNTHDIATWQDDAGNTCCIHAEIPQALNTLRILREVSQHGIEVDVEHDQGLTRIADHDGASTKIKASVKADVEVVFAHDWAWEADAKQRGRFWPGQL